MKGVLNEKQTSSSKKKLISFPNNRYANKEMIGKWPEGNEGHWQRESHWTEKLAVGSKDFVENIKDRLGIKVKLRNVTKGDRTYKL